MTAKKIIVAGFGGQGVMMIGQMIAYAGMLEGRHVTWLPAYGPEMRGGTANCSVIVSDREISSPVITKADAVVAMNAPSLEKFAGLVVPDGQLLINSSLIKDDVEARKDVHTTRVDVSQMANELGNGKASNMVMLGAIIGRTEIVSMESIFEVMKKVFKGDKARLIPLNKQALEEGAAFSRKA